jgi:hypothetical protein
MDDTFHCPSLRERENKKRETLGMKEKKKRKL